MIKTITLEQEDYNALHDIIFNVLGENSDMEDDLTNEYLLEIWKTIPEHIRDSAIHWGLDDSVVRDDIYEYLNPIINP